MSKTIQFTTLRAINGADSNCDAAVVAVKSDANITIGNTVVVRLADLPLTRVILFDLLKELGYRLRTPDLLVKMGKPFPTSAAEAATLQAYNEFWESYKEYLHSSTAGGRYNAEFPATEDDLLEVLVNYGTCAKAIDERVQAETHSDPVNSPSHYRMQVYDACGIPRDIEALEITDSLLKDVPEWVSFSTATCYKEALTYLLRMWKKGAPIQDAEKAVFYLLRMINRLNTLDDLPK